MRNLPTSAAWYEVPQAMITSRFTSSGESSSPSRNASAFSIDRRPRRGGPGGDAAVGGQIGEHRARVGALHLRERAPDRFAEPVAVAAEALQLLVDQVRDDLGVGLGGEAVAQAGELVLEREVVL